MSLSQVRTYFRSRITEVDSDLKEWNDAFNVDNIPENIIDARYHINMSSISTSPNQDVSFEDDFSVVITLWKRAFNSTIEEHDELLDIANCIRLNSLQPFRIGETDNIRQIESTGILLEPIDDSNDNTIKISLQFNVRLFFKITDFTL